MAYTKQIWEDLPSENTPISADSLNHMEEGIEEANKVLTVVSPTEPTTGEEVWIKKGKNLFNFLLLGAGYHSASIIEKEKNSIIFEGTATTFQYLTFKQKLGPGTYTFQRKWETISGSAISQTGAVIITNDADNSAIAEMNSSMSDVVFTLTEEITLRIVIYLSVTDSLTETTRIKIYDVQLESNDEATTFEETVDKEIYVKNDNGVYELFNKVEEPQYCQVTRTSSITLNVSSTQYEKIKMPFNKIDKQQGDFYLADGGIKIGKNINRIKLTVNIMVNNITQEGMFTLIARTNNEQAKAFSYFRLKAYEPKTFSYIIDVKENDIVDIAFQNQETFANNITIYGASDYATTSLLIEKIA